MKKDAGQSNLAGVFHARRVPVPALTTHGRRMDERRTLERTSARARGASRAGR
jgi:hypothetical protein